MNQDTAIGLLDRLHKAQNEFYAGGSGAALQQLLAPNIMWTVPGDNRIAGTYRGLEDVLSYFRRRRDLADHTFQMKRRDALVGDGDRIATMGNAEVQLPPDASKRVPVPLKPHGPRLERRSDDGQNDLETAMDDTDPGRLGSDVPGTVPQQAHEELAIWRVPASHQAPGKRIHGR
jgi:hypothetical protein